MSDINGPNDAGELISREKKKKGRKKKNTHLETTPQGRSINKKKVHGNPRTKRTHLKNKIMVKK